jgi:Domain of unknown function (DUF4382)
MNTTLQLIKRLCLVGVALGLAACGGGIGGTGAPQMGTLKVGLTDAPACGFEQVNVSVREVLVHQSPTAAEGDGGWISVVQLSPARRVDLLTLTNGVVEELGEASLPAGRYSQMRLVLAENTPADPLANSVKPDGRPEVALQTPSAQQSGLKLNVNIDVPTGQVADVVLDFDACKSVVQAGRSNRYLLKPVIAVLPRLSDAGARVVGYVDPAIALASTTISVQQNGVPIRSTPPVTTPGNTLGRFTLAPLPEGTYDLVVTADGRATALITGVPVQASTPTIVSSPTVRITPPPSAMRTVGGTVTITPAPTENLSMVRVVQRLTGGPAVEVIGRPVNATDGSFAFSLPIAATVRAGFVADPVSIPWVADSPSAARYDFEATASPGSTKIQPNVDVGATPAPVITFVFP